MINSSENVLITGDLVYLRPFQISDISDIYISWLNDKEVVRYSNQRFVSHTIESSLDYLNSFENTDNIYMAIIDKKNNDLVGSITIYMDNNHKVADIGLLIGNKKKWGKGFGFEAWTLMMDFLFNKCGIRKVTGGTLNVNYGMINIMKKSMMTHEATRKSHEVFENRTADMYYFCKFNHDV